MWRATFPDVQRAYLRSLFLSTPSVWRATQPARRRIQQRLISIHALRVEGDAGLGSPVPARWVFLSTPSVRRATRKKAENTTRFRRFLSTPSVRRATLLCHFVERVMVISIHALRAEGDQEQRYILLLRPYFYPRPPCGGRLLRTATIRQRQEISIHALRAEGDLPL